MYRVPYLQFAARFPICSFSGVKCWYSDRLDVTVVTSHVTTAYNFAEKTFANWLQTAKFAKVFSLESFPLYGINYSPRFAGGSIVESCPRLRTHWSENAYQEIFAVVTMNTDL